MSRVEAQQALMPSLLDRLIDPDSGGSSSRRGYGLTQMLEAVRRDVEQLLNTRQSHHGLHAQYTATQDSVLTYGLPDLVSLEAHTTQQRAEIGHVIEEMIARFEPRLRGVRATMVDAGELKGPGNRQERRVKFNIEARLCIDPAPEVGFETVVELVTGQTSIKSAEN